MITKDPWGVKLPFPDRTCKNCLKYPCFDGIKNTKSDLAMYGCKYYKD